MSLLSEKVIKGFKAILPSPLSIALILTLLTFVLAFLLTGNNDIGYSSKLSNLSQYWGNGLWGLDLIDGQWKRSWQLPFLVQMMLMLVLGYILALSPPVNAIILNFVKYCNSTSKAAFIISLTTILVSLFNWGLGLVYGAVFARKVAEYASLNKIKINYGLIGAAGYSGMMVWHGGLSGSAPIKVAEPGALQLLLPNSDFGVSQIAPEQTIFSSMNIFVSVLLIIMIPTCLYILGKKFTGKELSINIDKRSESSKNELIGAEKLDHSPLFSRSIGILIILYAIYTGFILPEKWSLAFLTPDFINLSLLGLAFFAIKI